MIAPLLNLLLALLLAPAFPGIINKTKAFFAGRKGPPILQLYFDIFKLLKKGSVYSKTVTPLFKIVPPLVLAATISAALFIPFAGENSLIHFFGDLFPFLFLLGMIRLFMVFAAMDTGSSFEGMGASREISFAAITEGSFFLTLATLAAITERFSLSGIYQALPESFTPVLFCIILTLILILLTENCRIPVDDPNTHLELTMIHEVMILDYSSFDLGLMLYGAAIKFWLIGTLIVSLLIPKSSFWVMEGFFLLGMIILAIVVGIIESTIARLRMLKVFRLLVAALALSVIAFVIQMMK